MRRARRRRARGAALLGIVGPDDADGARDYAEELGLGHPIASRRRQVWLDYAAREAPVVVLVGPGGRVLRGWPGGVDAGVLDEQLDALAPCAARRSSSPSSRSPVAAASVRRRSTPASRSSCRTTTSARRGSSARERARSATCSRDSVPHRGGDGSVVAEGELPAGEAENADPSIDWNSERIPTVCVMTFDVELPDEGRATGS